MTKFKDGDQSHSETNWCHTFSPPAPFRFFFNALLISLSSTLLRFSLAFWALKLISKTTVYTRVQVERVCKSNPIFEAKNTTFLEKV